jgi:hypothetical protein
VTTLKVLSRALLELAQPGTPASELLCHGNHGGSHVFNGLVSVSSQGTASGRNLLELPSQVRLTDSRVTVNVEQEPALIIINRESEVLLVLNHLSLAADETALLTVPDAVLEGPSLLCHSVPSTLRFLLGASHR